MKVVQAPDQRLRIKTKLVKKITPELLKLASEMIELTKTFIDPEGVGLAATQIGRQERFFVAKVGEEFKVFFNPQIHSKSKKEKRYFEGCLSIPRLWGETVRPISILASYMDESGQIIKRRLTGTLAWIFQHEVDHLDGTLYVDHVMKQKGKMYRVTGKDQAGSDILEEVRVV